jgi:hypothetical protein
MQETVTTLVKRNHNLHQENQELQQYLADARSAIDLLKQAAVAPSLEQELGGQKSNATEAPSEVKDSRNVRNWFEGV